MSESFPFTQIFDIRGSKKAIAISYDREERLYAIDIVEKGEGGPLDGKLLIALSKPFDKKATMSRCQFKEFIENLRQFGESFK